MGYFMVWKRLCEASGFFLKLLNRHFNAVFSRCRDLLRQLNYCVIIIGFQLYLKPPGHEYDLNRLFDIYWWENMGFHNEWVKYMQAHINQSVSISVKFFNMILSTFAFETIFKKYIIIVLRHRITTFINIFEIKNNSNI